MADWYPWLIAAHLAATLYMAGVIWFVQLDHYPLLACVGRQDFVRYETSHRLRVTCVVAPAMLVEAFSAAALCHWPPRGVPGWLVWLGMGLVFVNWIATAALSVPAHDALSRGYCERTIGRLVRTNWVRTVAWTARAIVALALVWPSIALATPSEW
ncbi:MAG: hypothetical protein KF774_03480 [Planctomyces sp.]|nr:hypothetical protein [Planctomyces sp.]